MKFSLILLDMDDVLADFGAGVARIWGLDPEKLRQERDSWCMLACLSRLLGSETPMTLDRFWHPIDRAGPDFWIGLPPTPWAIALVGLAKVFASDWRIVTHPSARPYAHYGKAVWAQSVFGQEGLRRLHPTEFKHDLAACDRLLIDDKEETVDAFRAAGGNALLFPTLHNSARNHADDPIGCLDKALRGNSSI